MQVQILSRSHPFVIRLFLACLAWSWVHEHIVVVDAEEAEVVEEELVELVTDPIDKETNRWKSLTLMARQRVFLSSWRLVTAWKWFGHWLTWKLRTHYKQKSRKWDSRLALSIPSVFKIQLTHRCYHLFWTRHSPDVIERRVWFASKNLTPCRMH